MLGIKLDIPDRTFKLGVQIIKLALTLPRNSAGYAVSGQIIRSGTSIGANVEEAQNCGSKKEFIHCMTISLKEARETLYWLRIVEETKLISKELLSNVKQENLEIIRVLTAIVKNSKKS